MTFDQAIRIYFQVFVAQSRFCCCKIPKSNQSEGGSVSKPRLSLCFDIFTSQCKINLTEKYHWYIYFHNGKQSEVLSAVNNGLLPDGRL